MQSVTKHTLLLCWFSHSLLCANEATPTLTSREYITYSSSCRVFIRLPLGACKSAADHNSGDGGYRSGSSGCGPEKLIIDEAKLRK